MASPKQVRMLLGIASKRVLEPAHQERLERTVASFSNKQVDEVLEWLRRQPEQPASAGNSNGGSRRPSDPGLYRWPLDGTELANRLFVIRERQGDRGPYRFARELVITQGSQADRARAADGFPVKLRSIASPGMQWKLTPAMAVSLEEVAALNIRFGECLICGTPIETKASVVDRGGIGPVCYKRQTALLQRRHQLALAG